MKVSKDQQCNEAREPQIPRQLELINEDICVLDELTQELIEKIKPVLSEQHLKVEEDNKAPETNFAPLASAIKHLHTRMKLINQAIKDSLDNIEL